MARCARAVSSARTPIAVAAAALAVAGLAFYIAAGSGVIGAEAPANVAPATASSPKPTTPSITPSASAPIAKAGPTASASPSVRLAAGTSTAPQTESGGAQRHTRAPSKGHKPKPPPKPGRHRTSTTLVASPSPATVNSTVTLTATEKASGGAHVAGNVQFEAGKTDLGSPVAVDADGVATTTTTFAASGKESLLAEFTPTSASYSGSKGTLSLIVRPVPPNVAGVVTISVLVPRTGAFTVTVQPGPVRLTPQRTTATGRLPKVTVTDTRNYRPGWSLSGQASKFTYSRTGKSVSGSELGWVPTVVGSLHDGAKLGRTVVPARPGLGSAPATLAYAPAGCGFGTNVFSANLTLNIPRADDGGRYTGTVTITYVESQPMLTDDDRGACGPSSRPLGGDR
jgi:Bacterial Ig-like domain (group 3)